MSVEMPVVYAHLQIPQKVSRSHCDHLRNALGVPENAVCLQLVQMQVVDGQDADDDGVDEGDYMVGPCEPEFAHFSQSQPGEDGGEEQRAQVAAGTGQASE